MKPIIHYNIPYALRFYNIEIKKIRDKDFIVNRKLISLFVPTGGWFALLLFKRRVKKTFAAILSTCDLYRLLQEKNWKESLDSLKDINDTVVSKREDLIKRKASQRAEQTSTAIQILGAIIAIVSIGWIQSIGSHPIPIPKGSEYFIIGIITTWILTWIFPKFIWYRRVVKFNKLEEREKEVYESLMKILKLAENKDITIKDFMSSFYRKRRHG
jgi:hypothetical protein